MVLLTGVTVGTGCSKPPETPAPEPTAFATQQVTLQLNWYPEAEHGGFYTALNSGYYSEAGLEVDIIAGGADVPVLQRVATGQATFGIENADRILLMRAEEADVVAVMAPLQNSPRCLVTPGDGGATDFSELQGFTIAMNTGEPFAQFLMNGVLPKNVDVVRYTGGVSHLLRGGKRAQQGYSFSEPILAEEQGLTPTVLMVSSAGFNPYTSCLVTSGKVIEASPEVVQRMVAASVRGWKEYLKNPSATNAQIHPLNPEMSLDTLASSAAAMLPLCVPRGAAGQPFGHMTAERWKTLADQMLAADSLRTAVDSRKAFRADWIPRTPAGISANSSATSASPAASSEMLE